MNHSDILKKNAMDSFQAQVESYLLGKIEVGVWPVGSKVPSERELAEALGVSRTTVRNAFLALTSRGIFERAIGQGTFVRRGVESKAVPGEYKGTLGYVVCKERGSRRPLSSEAFYFDVFSGIEEETSRSGRHTLFTYLDDFDGEELDAFESFAAKVDGIVVEEGRNGEFFRRLRSYGIPAVLLAPTTAAEGFDLVTMDLAAGVEKAVRAMRGKGHRRIAVVNGPLGIDTARLRYEAWRAAMAASGAEPEERLVAGGSGWTAEDGYAAVRSLMERSPDLTAIFCANDLLAIGALSALAELGIAVGPDVSVVGFDDTELARHSAPPLTTMRIHSRDMARTAARRLLERIEKPDQPAVKIEFPIDLVERKSLMEVRS